jgi:hypothetical protein
MATKKEEIIRVRKKLMASAKTKGMKDVIRKFNFGKIKKANLEKV